MADALSFKQAVKRALPTAILNLVREFKYKRNRLRNYRAYQDLLRGRSGVEIGGPSIFFRHALPLYPVIAALDGVNFSTSTMWEGSIKAGHHFEYMPGRLGRQFIAEATDLAGIASGSYEFLISSNCLEHVANPLRALEEWIRIVVPGGLLLLVLPNKLANFDHRRPVTTFEHLLDDYRKKTSEEDMTHLAEILMLHDLSRDPWAGARDNFVQRCRENFRFRGMHHHVFDAELIEKMAGHWGVIPLLRDATPTDLVFLGRTPGG